MCGIAGFIDTQHTLHDADQLIDRMCQVIRHRGPDDQGVWSGDGVALGARRLSIIDLGGGHQPIFNEDGSVLVVFNGEIYNYRQLQEELQHLGHRFTTNCDTEVIIHAYEEYGDDCVQHFRGMFTFALWDRKRQKLLAARDRFGKKPLNYYWDGQKLIFGSEIKSILEAGIPRAINIEALDEYLAYSYVPAPNTLFKDVMKVPAAHVLIYENGQVSTKRYWELSFTPTNHDDEATAIERLRALLQDAVKVRLMSEVPLGAFLSGGTDSSLVVGLMSSMMSQPVKTFSIGFQEEDFSELPYARQIAQHFGTEHHEFFVRPDLISVLPELAWAYDEPFADPSMLPTYYVSKLAREYVTVVLTGDGGDEIFAGYEPYQREYHINRIPSPLRFVLGCGGMLFPDGMRGKERLRSISHDLATRCIRISMPFPDGWRASLYTPEHFALVSGHNPFERLASKYQAVSNLDVTAQMQYADVNAYLTDDILVKVDKASMLNSLETRAPLLDQYLAEYVTSLPTALRMRNGTLKYLLKRAVEDIVPAEVLSRPKKGFSVPIKYWFRGELSNYAYDLLDSTRARQRGIFDPQYVRDLLKSHASTRMVNLGNAIWTLLCLELWFQVYIDQPASYVERSPQTPIASNREL